MTNHVHVSKEEKVRRKPFYGRTTSGRSCAFRVDGVDGTFVGKNFGRQLEMLRALKAFRDRAEHVAHVRGSQRAVKAWVKENKPSQFFAVWTPETDFYHDDSVEIFYTQREDEEQS